MAGGGRGYNSSKGENAAMARYRAKLLNTGGIESIKSRVAKAAAAQESMSPLRNRPQLSDTLGVDMPVVGSGEVVEDLGVGGEPVRKRRSNIASQLGVI